MKKSLLVCLFAMLVLCGCAKNANLSEGSTAPEETQTVYSVPPDGNPGDVTCRGSYTREGSADAVVARVGDKKLTNSQLAVWYWAQAAQYAQSAQEEKPDWDIPLDQQSCPVDRDVSNWQQYFLKQALHTWHTAAALNQHSADEPLATEEAYQPNLDNYETYMTGMPAAQFLYGYNPYFAPNTMHQSWLNGIADMLESMAKQQDCTVDELARRAFGASAADVTAMVEFCNRAYMYFTTLTYDLALPQVDEGEESGAYTVNIRHILLVPGEKSEEEAISAFRAEAKKRLQSFSKPEKYTESVFADLAHFYSQDSGTAADGGIYRRIVQGQLPEEMDAWCFAPERQSGDTTIITDGNGIHILYFSGRESLDRTQQKDAQMRQQQAECLETIREKYPMKTEYSVIALPEAEGSIAMDQILYPDVAHERFPEVPLYLQQDYPTTMYGGFKIRTNGCGITSLAMLASYLADDELTPPEMCARYGRYSHRNGTDGMIFVKEPAAMGFYLIEKTYNPTVARDALGEGHIVISVQHPGYWTRAGHYIVLEKVTQNDKIQVRDSNIYNYVRIPAHVDDAHSWRSITGAGSGYWIYDYKVTRVTACSRCGDPQQAEGLLTEEYYCERCETALMRRNTYLDS